VRSSDEYIGQPDAWCPGCGNHLILRAFKEALAEMDLDPHRFVIVSGIGQAGKFPHSLKCNTFNGLHGRTLPVATGIKLTNPDMLTIAVAGDGDCYGEGGNHLLHTIRKNPDIKLFVHNNQIYGLTKGQASPTSMHGMKTKVQPSGVLSEQFNPLAFAVAMDCSFVARSYAGNKEHLKSMIKQAVSHRGFSLVDILQPCVTFNKLNTYEWYGSRVRELGTEYNPEDRMEALKKSFEWGDEIPIGVIYKNSRQTIETRINSLYHPYKSVLPDNKEIEKILKEFY
jgi:2-oxoglutarate ferredoxin oxidoreductase subunit beta